MAERSRRGIRRQVSDTTDDVSEPSASESEIDWDPRKSDSARRAGRAEPSAPSSNSRSRRAATDDSKHSIRLTMKVAPSKLREVMRANEVDSLQDTLGGGKVIDGPRSRRAAVGARASTRAAGRPKYAEFGESDIEDEDEDEEEQEEEEEEEEEEEDEDEEAEDEEMNDFEELGAEVEGGTDDEDIEMDDAPPPPAKKQPQPKRPKITLKPPPPAAARQGAKTKISVKPPNVGPLKSVEDQEIDDELEEAEDDEQSSELSEDEDATNLNEDNGDGEEEMIEEEDVEGEDRDIDEDEEDPDGEDDDDEDDSGNETPASGTGTPDPARLTKRQRGRPEDQGGLMALDMAPQQRKFFTAEEKAMKKDEHARKRKELTKRKINEEKAAALNRLLKPQASKARGAAPKPETLAAAAAAAVSDEYEIPEKVSPLYVRWVSTKDGVKLGVPEEWLGKNAGKYFGPPPSSNGLLVQEVE